MLVYQVQKGLVGVLLDNFVLYGRNSITSYNTAITEAVKYFNDGPTAVIILGNQ